LKTFVLLLITILYVGILHAQSSDTLAIYEVQDTISVPDSPVSDSLEVSIRDSLRTALKDSLRRTSELKSRVKYTAKDSIVFDLQSKLLLLYGDVKLEYEDIVLKAERVDIDWTTTTLYAKGIEDSTGQFIGQPEFSEGGQIYKAEEIVFNFNTRKGRILGGRTQQDENFVIGDTIKRNPDNSYFIRSGKITTCSHEDPHFYIYSYRMKVIPNDKVITGRVHMVVEKVPVPLVLPFGFFPNKKGKKSGILMPTYGLDPVRGYFLREGGYYSAIGEYVDLAVKGDIYSYGSYRYNFATRYNYRYRFDGGLDFQYSVNNNGDRNNVDYRENKDFMIKWRHSQSLGNTARLSSDVNAGTSSFLGTNSFNTQDIVTNTLMSNVSYSKTFANTPWSLNARLGHDQNTQTRIVNLELPSIGLNRGRTFPFKRKTGGGSERWYEKIGYSYSSQMVNRISIADTLLFKQTNMDAFRNGIKHDIPVQMNFKALKYLTISPGVNYSEFWYWRQYNQSWVPAGYSPEAGRTLDSLRTDTLRGMLTGREFSASVSATTRIYGMYPTHSKRQRVYRHTFTPNISYTYRPDFSTDYWGYYYKVQTDTAQTPDKYTKVSKFNNSVFGGPSALQQQSIGFGMINLFEMKYKSQRKGQDTLLTKPEVKKLTLIDNLGMNGNYNFAADSFKLSNINLSARTILFRDLLNINVTGVMDPYAQHDSSGLRLKTYRWQEERKLGYITNSNIAVSTSFRSKKEKPTRKTKNIDPAILAEIERNRDLYADFNIPWSLNLSYNLNYSRTNHTLKQNITQSVNASGDVNLTEKWKIRITTGYDFTAKDMTITQVNIIRDLHCWEASFNTIPFGNRKYFMLTINAKSATLQDLKLTKQNPPNFNQILR